MVLQRLTKLFLASSGPQPITVQSWVRACRDALYLKNIENRNRPDSLTAGLAHKLISFRSRTTPSVPRPGTRRWNPLTLALLASLWIATSANWPLWRALALLPEMTTRHGAVTLSGFFVIVAALTFLLLAPLAWHWSIKPAITLFLLPATAIAHFMGSYNIVIDTTMMMNVLHTDPREVRDLLSVTMLGNLLVLAVFPIAWLWRAPIAPLHGSRQLGRNILGIIGALLAMGITGFMLFADLSATMRNHHALRFMINPINSFYALGKLAYDSGVKRKGPIQPMGHDAHLAVRPAGAKPPLLMLVIGETARAANFSLNGYARPTNPELEKLGVVSFLNVSSCGTSTASSLPCMFSHLGREAYAQRSADHENLVDLLHHAGLGVLWLDNQSGCKSLCDRVPHAMAREPAPGAAPLPAGLCSHDGECLDEALLHGLDARLAALPAERRAKGVVLVVHQMGSHGPAYASRSPADRKPFMPECTTNVLQQCYRQQLINAYDNSIAYTDHVLAGSIRWLQQQAAAFEPSLIYVSDHGESLGENNLYLHGLPYAIAPWEQTQVPFIAWMPSRRGEPVNAVLACLQAKRDLPLSHDHLFHTVLGALGITAAEYQPQLDAFAACADSAKPGQKTAQGRSS